MANQEHLDILRQGVDVWNQWRKKHSDVRPDLRGADLTGADLTGFSLYRVDLTGVNLTGVNLTGVNLSDAALIAANLIAANLNDANLNDADLSYADLSYASLNRASLMDANLSYADLYGASLIDANLNGAQFIETSLASATLTRCAIYGISAWNVQLEGTRQDSLVITGSDEPTITVDNLEVAQFIYLLLNNQKIRQTIDTITSQVVLILGNFPSERKSVVEALCTELRCHKYSPVVFNFEEANNKDFTATVRTLANMACFVLLDPTHLDETLRELADALFPRCVVPIQPLLLRGSHQQEYERIRVLYKHRWVLAPYHYKDVSDLQSSFREQVLQPVKEKMIELKQKPPLKIFLGYAPEDKTLLKKLKMLLSPLVRLGIIEVWDDQDVNPGEEKREKIFRHLSEARMILLLLSPDFLDSDECYDQMHLAMQRYEQAEASVIPILLRPCAWKATPLKDLMPLPRDGTPLSKHHEDDIFFEVSEEIVEMIKGLE